MSQPLPAPVPERRTPSRAAAVVLLALAGLVAVIPAFPAAAQEGSALPSPVALSAPSLAPAAAASPATAPAASATPTPTLAPLPERLEARVRAWRDAVRVPGLAVALRLPDGSTWTSVGGRVAPGGGNAWITPSTPFAIASITKTFVAALALQLRDEGVLSLDAPVRRWMPELRRAGRITVRMLLAHRSGLADYFWHPRYEQLVFGRPDHAWTVEEILALAAQRAPLFRPGAGYSYSNTNYVVLGRIIERATGRPLAALLRERFFEPLGLASATFQGDEPVPDGAAQGWLREDRVWRELGDGTAFRPNTSAATVAWAAGALLLSVEDLLRWEEALYGGEVLSPASLAEMLSFGKEGYGLGARFQSLGGLAGFGHGGSLRGFVSAMYREPLSGVGVVGMTNRGSVDLNSLVSVLVAEVLIPETLIAAAATPLPSASPALEGSPLP